MVIEQTLRRETTQPVRLSEVVCAHLLCEHTVGHRNPSCHLPQSTIALSSQTWHGRPATCLTVIPSSMKLKDALEVFTPRLVGGFQRERTQKLSFARLDMVVSSFAAFLYDHCQQQLDQPCIGPVDHLNLPMPFFLTTAITATRSFFAS